MKKVLPILSLICFLTLFQVQSYSQSIPEICLVTVDPLSTHNIIVYDKTGHDDADFYIIYRENASGGYDALDSIDRDSLSEYHDMTALVNVRAYRYKISLVDTFGVESSMSLYHRTVFCDEPSTGLFAWNVYEIEGSPNPTTGWVMLREDEEGVTGWMPIDTIPGTTTSFIDQAISSFPVGVWRVRNLWGISCNSTRVGVNTSRSNVRNQTMNPSAIHESEIHSFSVYPNPADQFLRITGIYYNEPYQITDMTGKSVVTGNLSGVDPQLEVKNLTDGLYLVTIRNSTVKWFKN